MGPEAAAAGERHRDPTLTDSLRSDGKYRVSAASDSRIAQTDDLIDARMISVRAQALDEVERYAVVD